MSKMNIDAIFDVVGQAASIICLEIKIQDKKEQIINFTQRNCGNCWHWMKTSCVPEKERGSFRSMNSYACQDFAYCSSDLERIGQFKRELSKLELEMARFEQGE